MNHVYINAHTGEYFQKHRDIWLGPQANIDFHTGVAKHLFDNHVYKERTYKVVVSWFERITYV